MNETTGQAGSIQSVRYELYLTKEEAILGTTKLLTRNGKRLEVKVPTGVIAGSLVKLGNALELTDGHPGDIIIEIKIKPREDTSTMSEPMGVVEITDSTFEVEVLNSHLPVVVDFWAPWCGPCRMMAPLMEKAAEQYNGKFKFCKINVDENPGMASQYQAMSIPLLLFFKNGQVVDRSLGAIPENALHTKIESFM